MQLLAESGASGRAPEPVWELAETVAKRGGGTTGGWGVGGLIAFVARKITPSLATKKTTRRSWWRLGWYSTLSMKIWVTARPPTCMAPARAVRWWVGYTWGLLFNWARASMLSTRRRMSLVLRLTTGSPTVTVFRDWGRKRGPPFSGVHWFASCGGWKRGAHVDLAGKKGGERGDPWARGWWSPMALGHFRYSAMMTNFHPSGFVLQLHSPD